LVPLAHRMHRHAVGMDPFKIRLFLSAVLFSTMAASARSQGAREETSASSDDATPPEILHVGNHGAYTVDEDVAIYCVASDAGSGLIHNDCRAISGPAYSFSIGTNVFTARAIDGAGNAVVVTTAFEVRITFESLRRLVDRFTTDEAIDRRLYAILVEAETGRDEARGRAIDAFDATLECERGRAIEEGDADLLIALAEYQRSPTPSR
jgi:hypothetical protein